jgi:hypothetical protein
VGERKRDAYGARFVEAIADYLSGSSAASA